MRFPSWMMALYLLTIPTGALAADRIPLDVLFSQSTFISPRLSPDGEKIAFIAQVGEHQVIGVRGLHDAKPALIGRNSERQFRWFWLDWANSERLLVGAQTLYRSPEFLTKVRYRATRLMGIDIDGSSDVILGSRWPRASFSAVQYQDRIVHLWPDDHDYVLIQLRAMNDRFATVQRMNVNTGRLRHFDQAQAQVLTYFADGNGAVRAGAGLVDGFVARVKADGPFTNFALERTSDPDGHLNFAGYSADPAVVWVYDTLDDFTVVRQFDLTTGALTGPAYGAVNLDVRSVFADPLSRVVMGYTYIDDELQYAFLNADWEAAYAPVLDALPGNDVDLVSVSADGRRAILSNAGDNLPLHYYLYDRSGDKPVLSPIGRAYPELSDHQLATSRALRFKASDGLEISAYLTLPPASGGKNLPTVVVPHGGPVARDYLHWDRDVQFLSNRGYAVLRLNFRGSSGYGKRFREAAFREWGGRMQQDIAEGVKHLIEQGIADPDRIAIWGTSYGGYAALMGAVRDPELYQAAISYAGVTYLPWLENEFAEGLGNFNRVFREMSREQINAASPAEHTASIRVPILLGHGDLDSRVNVRHSRRMAKNLEQAGKPMRYIEFEDEIHGFLLEENRLRWYAAIEQFLAQHLDHGSVVDGAPK